MKGSSASRSNEMTYVKVTGAAGGDDLASGSVNHAVSVLSLKQFAFALVFTYSLAYWIARLPVAVLPP